MDEKPILIHEDFRYSEKPNIRTLQLAIGKALIECGESIGSSWTNQDDDVVVHSEMYSIILSTHIDSEEVSILKGEIVFRPKDHGKNPNITKNAQKSLKEKVFEKMDSLRGKNPLGWESFAYEFDPKRHVPPPEPALPRIMEQQKATTHEIGDELDNENLGWTIDK